MLVTLNYQTVPMFSQNRAEGSPESRLWSSVILLLIEDAKVIKKAMTQYYELLKPLKHRHNFFTNVKAQEYFLCLDAWDSDRQRVINEATSEWFEEVCAYIGLCDKRLLMVILQYGCVEEKILIEMRFWRGSFIRAIQDREQEAQIANGGRLKKKKKKDNRPYAR